MESVFLSTYYIRLKSSRIDGDNVMGLFNGKDDFLPVLKSYFDDIFASSVQVSNDDEEISTKLDLTLKSPPTVVDSDRVIYGYFDVGISGQEILVKNRADRKEVFKGDRDKHGLYRYLFFYIQLPFKSQRGYLIIQNRSRFGVKSGFARTLRKWLTQKGYQDTVLRVQAVLNSQVFNKMLEYGNLKKVNFIANYLPNNIEEFYANGQHPNTAQGTMTTTIQSKGGLPQYWISFAKTQYQKVDRKAIIELENSADNEDEENDKKGRKYEKSEKEYSEIEFELELNGRRKTFYAVRRERTLPALDVTSEIERDVQTGEPLLSSLLDKCREIVEDTFEIKPNV